MKLFTKENIKGVFRGFSEGGLEFHADIILKYQNEFQSIPMHGQFLIVSLEHDDEAVLGRVTSISAQGRLSSSAGEDYGIRAIEEDRPIPEDLREQYLKYKVDIRVLGVIRVNGKDLIFSPSHRRLPHVGSKVAFLSFDLLKEIAGHNIDGAEFGYFALGEFIYSGSDTRLKKEDWMQIKSPAVIPKFEVKNLVSRRSFVFARAGFGKSNLIKLLFSSLYKNTPTVTKRGNKAVPVGTIIFDPDGEYFWPDDKDRPGLCDVPHLEDKVVVFTNKQGPSAFYQSFVAGNIKLDVRQLKPSEVISIALPIDKQDQQNVRKLKGLNQDSWKKLVDEVYRNKNAADEKLIAELLYLKDTQEAETIAARANMTFIVSLLHDPSSQMKDMLIASLREGKICIVDISQMRGQAGLILSGILLQQIFNNNQLEFTKAESRSIPTIAVLEEAQSVLGGSGGSESPYIAWVKEGRKYDLGAVLITQQPGSISNEILSQGDNWFIFHLLSAGDLRAVKNANAHFSDDLLSALLNEPIPGNGIFWSSSSGKTYPISVRVLSFEGLYQTQDPTYSKTSTSTYATQLKNTFESILNENKRAAASYYDADVRLNTSTLNEPGLDLDKEINDEEAEDVQETYIRAAIAKMIKNEPLKSKISTKGCTWREILEVLKENLPNIIENREGIAYNNVERAMNEMFGKDRWTRERRPKKTDPNSTTIWVVMKTKIE